MKRVIIFAGISIVLLLSYINLKSFSNGIAGRTRKNLNEPEIGCSCHRVPLEPNVLVRIFGPAQVYKNDTAVYRITVTGGPHVKAGFDFNVARGGVDVAEPDSTQNFGDDITHRFPKIFGLRDTIGWYVKFIAPSTVGPDTLYATSNSVNGNGIADTLDRWNFSDDFIVNVIDPIGIQPINNKVPENYSLLQNYPNPFNPVTKIKFDIPRISFQKRGLVSLKVYDILGREAETLVNEKLNPGTYEIDFDGTNYPSGIYFYSLQSGGYKETKKMMLVK